MAKRPPFQSTLPARGATAEYLSTIAHRSISIHAPRTGSDLTISLHFCAYPTFQSTLPARGATILGGQPRTGQRHFNPRSPHGERRDRDWLANFARQFQSTLPARGATHDGRRRTSVATISIHAPRTGSDGTVSRLPRTPGAFQSTLPARGATQIKKGHAPGKDRFQSTLPARGATPDEGPAARAETPISIHAPRTGSDTWPFSAFRDVRESFQSTLPARGATPRAFCAKGRGGAFQSTLPARGATLPPPESAQCVSISIHAPRTGSDTPEHASGRQSRQFQSTLPARGATAPRPALAIPTKKFQSTLPARGATSFPTPGLSDVAISIHAPRTGSDKGPRSDGGADDDFNPRSPHGERPTRRTATHKRRHDFNPRSPHGERHH